MAQISTPPVVQKRSGASSNIYTVLAVVAFLALAVGVAYVWWRSTHLFNSSNPFEVPTRPAAGAPR